MHLLNFLHCILQGRGVPQRRVVFLALRDLPLVPEHFIHITDTHTNCLGRWLLCKGSRSFLMYIRHNIRQWDQHEVMGLRGVYTMVRSHKATQNESNLLFLVTFFAIMTLSEQIKVSQSSPSMWLSVFKKI